jgi:hypothetical protein
MTKTRHGVEDLRAGRLIRLTLDQPPTELLAVHAIYGNRSHVRGAGLAPSAPIGFVPGHPEES